MTAFADRTVVTIAVSPCTSTQNSGPRGPLSCRVQLQPPSNWPASIFPVILKSLFRCLSWTLQDSAWTSRTPAIQHLLNRKTVIYSCQSTKPLATFTLICWIIWKIISATVLKNIMRIVHFISHERRVKVCTPTNVLARCKIKGHHQKIEKRPAHC